MFDASSKQNASPNYHNVVVIRVALETRANGVNVEIRIDTLFRIRGNQTRIVLLYCILCARVAILYPAI